MATIPSVQLFRNSNIISGRSAAIDTLERKKEYVPDGGLILATYSSDNGVKTLLGIVRNSGSENAQITIMDVEGAAENVQDAIDALSAYTNTKLTEEKNARESADTTLQSNIDALSSSTDTKIANETSARQSADTTLQTNIDNVNSALTAHTANTTVHVTQADKDKWNTPTDLSKYYTKTEVDSTIESYGQVTSQALNDLGTRLDDYGKVTSQSLNDLSTKFGDYYTKTEVDSKDATLQTALDALGAHVSENEDIVSQSLNDLNNRIGDTYVKSYIDALEARIAELEAKFLNMENNGLQAGEY